MIGSSRMAATRIASATSNRTWLRRAAFLASFSGRASAHGYVSAMYSFAASMMRKAAAAPPSSASASIAVRKSASARVATFFVSFLAVQCVLNALFDLKTVFFLSSSFAPAVPTDAVNMAHATGIPAIFWAALWIAVALGILWFAMRLYVAGRDKSYQPDLPFEETPPVG